MEAVWQPMGQTITLLYVSMEQVNNCVTTSAFSTYIHAGMESMKTSGISIHRWKKYVPQSKYSILMTGQQPNVIWTCLDKLILP